MVCRVLKLITSSERASSHQSRCALQCISARHLWRNATRCASLPWSKIRSISEKIILLRSQCIFIPLLLETSLFRDGPSVLDLNLLGVHSPREEREGGVHLFGLGEERLGHFDHCLVGLLGGRDIEAKITSEMMLAVLAGEFLLLKHVLSSWCGVC